MREPFSTCESFSSFCERISRPWYAIEQSISGLVISILPYCYRLVTKRKTVSIGGKLSFSSKRWEVRAMIEHLQADLPPFAYSWSSGNSRDNFCKMNPESGRDASRVVFCLLFSVGDEKLWQTIHQGALGEKWLIGKSMLSEQLDQVLLNRLDHTDPEGEVHSSLVGRLFYRRLRQFQHLATSQYSCKSFIGEI